MKSQPSLPARPFRLTMLTLALTLSPIFSLTTLAVDRPTGGTTTKTLEDRSQTVNTTVVDLRQRSGNITRLIDGGDIWRVSGTRGLNLRDPNVRTAARVAQQSLKDQLPDYPAGATTKLLSRRSGAGGSSTSSRVLVEEIVTNVTTTELVGEAFFDLPAFNAPPPNGRPVERIFVAAGDTVLLTQAYITETYNETLTLTGDAATITTNQRQRLIRYDLGAVYSTLFSGLPLALVQPDLLTGAHQGIGDINNRVLRTWLGNNGATVPQGDGPEGNVQIFTAGDFGWLSQDRTSNAAAGFDDTRASASLGAEWNHGTAFSFGLAGTWLDSETDFDGGLGSETLSGGALSAYATWKPGSFFGDLLYSGARFDVDTSRDTLTGSTAEGSSTAWSHLVSLNTGYNFKIGDTFSTGPIAALTYLHGQLDGFTEQGGGSARLRFEEQDYDSLQSTLGWQASWKIRRPWGSVTPLLHVAWKRENLSNDGRTSVALERSPFGMVNGSQLTRFGSFSASTDRGTDSADTLAAGLAITIEAGPRWTIHADATARTDFADREALALTLRVGYRF